MEMLAYVFWHWRRPDVAGDSYRNRVIDFHQTLAMNKPTGFRASVVFELADAPWAPTTSEVYEDWYLLEGSCALDVLNDAAVSPPCKLPHDEAAQGAAGGTGGLYRLRCGEAKLAGSQFATWFSKPAGTKYDALYAMLGPWFSQPGVGLWGRQMTLGPTPEFCLLTSAKPELPEALRGSTIRLKPIRSGQ